MFRVNVNTPEKIWASLTYIVEFGLAGVGTDPLEIADDGLLSKGSLSKQGKEA